MEREVCLLSTKFMWKNRPEEVRSKLNSKCPELNVSFLPIKKYLQDWGCDSVVECLLVKHEALSSNPVLRERNCCRKFCPLNILSHSILFNTFSKV
jgi:hypothetical protein